MSAQEELIAKWGASEFESRLAAKLGEYHHLIPRESAIALLHLEACGATPRPETLNRAAKAFSPCTVRVRAERVFPARVSERDGGASRSQRLSVSDHSGAGTLVLYDSACSALERLVMAGDLVQAGPVRFRGGEYHLLPGGTIERLQKGPRMKIDDKSSSSPIGHFEGEVSAFFGDFPYKRGQTKLGGEAPAALMSSFELSDPSGKCRVVLWDSPGMGGTLKAGTPVQIENGQRRGGEIHINSSGRLLMEEVREKPRPKIEKMEIREEKKEGGFEPALLVFLSDGRSFPFPSLDEAAARLGAGPVPDGMNARTVLALKMKEWMGRPLPESWEKYAVHPNP